ncbi:hypothetical protein ABW19_dt0208719 [Dactylella cylindrospora]|nr:hypothetical protein ABW19_dt0208719 [Dactylella cylindrospora]
MNTRSRSKQAGPPAPSTSSGGHPKRGVSEELGSHLSGGEEPEVVPPPKTGRDRRKAPIKALEEEEEELAQDSDDEDDQDPMSEDDGVSSHVSESEFGNTPAGGQGTIDAGDRLSQDSRNISNQLESMSDLSDESDSMINFFTRRYRNPTKYLLDISDESSETSERFLKVQENFWDVMKIYSPMSCIDLEVMQVSLGDAARSFSPIFQKANIAAITTLLCKPPSHQKGSGEHGSSYYTHGGWLQLLYDLNICQGIDPAKTYNFVTLWRTHLYIMGVENPPKSVAMRSNWPDECLFGNFCSNAEVSQMVLGDKFEERLRDATLKGWGAYAPEAPENVHDRLINYIMDLRKYTSDTAKRQRVDLKGLHENFPYSEFLGYYREWAVAAMDRFNSLKPSIPELIDVASVAASDIDQLAPSLKKLVPEERPTRNSFPSVAPPSTDPNRRHTYGGPEVHVSSSASTLLSKDPGEIKRGMKALRHRKQFGTLGSSSLKPPANKVPPSSQTAMEIGEPAEDLPAAGKEILHIIKDIANTQEKENKKPFRRFNELQAGAVKINFDEERELRGGSQATSQQRQATVESSGEATNPEVEVGAPMHEPDEGAGPSTSRRTASGSRLERNGRDQNKRKRVVYDDDSEDSEDEFRRLPSEREPIPNKRRRAEGTNGANRLRAFEDRAKASRPNPRQEVPGPNRVQIDQSRSPSGPRSRAPAIDPSEMRLPVLAKRRRPPRREWSEEDTLTLVEAIGTIGPNWAVIRDSYFGGRWSNVDCKDKARNMKRIYLRNHLELPEGFENVTMGTKYVQELADNGIHYEDGWRRGTPFKDHVEEGGESE